MGGDDNDRKTAMKTQGQYMGPSELLAAVMEITSASLGVARKLGRVPLMGSHLST